MSGINVLSRTQKINVRPTRPVSVTNAGPAGPRGYKGDEGPILDIPQLGVLPITVMGHSWTVPAGWHTTGNHWSQRLDDVGLTGPITNIGISGTTMEYWTAVIDANPSGAYGAYDWGRPSAKTLCLMMNVLNSAKYQPVDLDYSVESFRKCARMCAATVLSDRIPSTTGQNGIAYVPGWALIGLAVSYTGSFAYTYFNNKAMTWTVPADKDYAWLATLATCPEHPSWGINDSVFQMKLNGDIIYETEGGINIDTLNGGSSSDYGKTVIPIGPVSAGDVLTWEKISGTEDTNNTIWFDGIMTLNDKHHIAFTKDPMRINSATYPDYSVESISAHNAVLDDIKAEFDAIAPDLVSIIDLEDISTFDASTMLWSGDTLHPNDKGQPWLTEELAKGLSSELPYTTRLHTL